jgi:hypothetical protein
VDEESTNPSINLDSTSRRPLEQSITPEAPTITGPKGTSDIPKNIQPAPSYEVTLVQQLSSQLSYSQNFGEFKHQVHTLDTSVKELKGDVGDLKDNIQEVNRDLHVWKLLAKGAGALILVLFGAVLGFLFGAIPIP